MNISLRTMRTAPENFGLKKNRPLKFKQSFVKHREIHFRHFLPVWKICSLGTPVSSLWAFFCSALARSFFSEGQGPCVVVWIRAGVFSLSSFKRDVYLIVNKFGKSENWELCTTTDVTFQQWKPAPRARYPLVVEDVSHLRLPLWLSQPFYIVMLSMGRDI